MTVSSAGLMQNSVQRCSLRWLEQWHGLRLSAASDTFAWVLFSTQKRVQHLAFWLFWFCVCGHWLFSPSPHGHLASARSRVCQIWLTRMCQQEPSTSETAADVQFSIARLSNLKKRPGSLPGGWRHTETLAIVVRPRPSKSVPFFFFRNTSVRLRSTVTGCWQTQVLISQTFIRYLSPVEAKWALWREGSVEPERFLLVWGFFCPEEEEKTKKEVLG